MVEVWIINGIDFQNSHTQNHKVFLFHFNKMLYLPDCQMVCMVDFAVLVLESLLTHVSLITLLCTYNGPRSHLVHMCCYVTLVVLHISTHPVNPVQICLQNKSWISFGSLFNLTAC